jgi:hypothetical protein
MGIYALMPLAFGFLGSTDPDGPKIYPAAYHRPAYILGRFLAGQNIPRNDFYDRPWFYFMRRHLRNSAPQQLPAFLDEW